MMSWKRLGLEFVSTVVITGFILYLLKTPLKPVLNSFYGDGEWYPLAIPLLMTPYLVFACRATDSPVSMAATALSAAVIGWGAISMSWSLFVTGLIPLIPSLIIFTKETKRRHEERINEMRLYQRLTGEGLTPDEEEFLADLYDDLSNGGSD